MKKTNYLKLSTIFIALLLSVLTSCSKEDDFTNSSIISGTTWKCTSGTNFDTDLDYASLKFKSKTVVEGWSKYKNKDEQQDWTGSFIINDKKITIDTGADNETILGTISGKEMTVTIAENGTFIFTKQ